MSDDWIEWDGGNCPVGPEDFVVVKFRQKVGGRHQVSRPLRAYVLVWWHDKQKQYAGGDIVAYRPSPPAA